jgi:hypothetical protein
MDILFGVFLDLFVVFYSGAHTPKAARPRVSIVMESRLHLHVGAFYCPYIFWTLRWLFGCQEREWS